MQANAAKTSRRDPVIIDAKAAIPDFTIGDRVFHQKFGYGAVEEINDDKLSVAFEKAGTKKVVASYVEKAEKAGGMDDEIPF